MNLLQQSYLRFINCCYQKKNGNTSSIAKKKVTPVLLQILKKVDKLWTTSYKRNALYKATSHGVDVPEANYSTTMEKLML